MPTDRRHGRLYVNLTVALFGVVALVWSLDVRHLRRPVATLTAGSSALEFVIAERPAALEWRPVESLFAMDLESIIDIGTGRPLVYADGDARFAAGKSDGESLTLESMALPVGTVVALQEHEAPSEWDVEIAGRASERPTIRISSNRPVTVIVRGREERLPPPVGLELRFREGSIRFILPSQQQRLLYGAHVNRLEFQRLAGARTPSGDMRRAQPS